MFGFISALSSTLCVFLLVFITVTLGYIQSLIPPSSFIRVEKLKYQYVINNYYITKDVVNDLLSYIDTNEVNVESYTSSCNYGFDVSFDESESIGVYNTLVLSKHLKALGNELNIIFGDSKELENRLNYCTIIVNVKDDL